MPPMADTESHSLPGRTPLLVCGILGTLGALLILIADIVYNRCGGDRLGTGLYISTWFGIFFFPLWWAGIWVLYRGLRPAGLFWSLCPCLLFAFLVSTVDVSGHAAYPFWAAIDDAGKSPHEAVVLAVRQIESHAMQYTGRLALIQTVLEILLSVWIAVPILRERTLFPRWLALLIPIFPTIAALLIDALRPGFFGMIEPYIASGCMVFAFAAATVVLLRDQRGRAPYRDGC
jgi:hypothetical protein